MLVARLISGVFRTEFYGCSAQKNQAVPNRFGSFLMKLRLARRDVVNLCVPS